VRDRVIGAIKLYRVGGREISVYDENVARSLARVLSVYLEVAELDERAALATKAELEALRAQISPHFLFNTLTTIASLTRTDPQRAHALIIDLAEFFRSALVDHGELVPLERELEYVERYLRFESARYGERLRVEYNIDRLAYGAPVPLLAIQVLVQNAVVHGIVPLEKTGSVSIAARPNRGVCEVIVRDDGVGMESETLKRVLSRGVGSGAGIGLDNVQRRLVALFGPRHGLQIESEPGRGTIARFTVPLPS
jgi:two-component system LytT family sensor kinase